MIELLANVPGFLKQIKDRLSATWAAKLDTLHDTRLTSARAGYLDKLNISGNVAGSAEVAALSMVQSIQTGYVSAVGTAGSVGTEDWQYIDVAIASVVPGKCIAFMQSAVGIVTNNPVGPTARVTSATNLRVALRASTAAANISGRWTVLELK